MTNEESFRQCWLKISETVSMDPRTSITYEQAKAMCRTAYDTGWIDNSIRMLHFLSEDACQTTEPTNRKLREIMPDLSAFMETVN